MCQIPENLKPDSGPQPISTKTLLAGSLSELALELGAAIILSDGTFLPVAPFIWAAIALPDIINSLSGRPKFQDTEAVIAAYNKSAYEPLHALTADMAICVKNGAPISDSNPAVQKTFSAAKQGTIESIQQQAGLTPGPSSPGYWQLQNLINTSWSYSAGGETAVLQVVKAIDCMTEGLSQIAQQTKPPPPPPSPPGQPPPNGPPGDICIPADIVQALIACLCDDTSDTCCTAVVGAIAKVAQQLTVIANALAFGGKGSPPVDLIPLIAAIGNVATAVGAYPPALEACCAAINSSLGGIKDAITNAPGDHTKGIADSLNQTNTNDISTAAIVDYFIPQKVIPPEVGQLFSDRPWPCLHTVLKGAASVSPIIGWLESYLGDDADAKAGQRMNAARVDALLSRGAKALHDWNPDVNRKMLADFKTLLQGTITKESTVVGALLAPFVDLLETGLTPKTGTQIGNIGIDPNTPINTATSLTISADIAAWIGSYFGIDEGASLAKLVELVAAIVGFDELNEVTLGPLIRHGVAKVADMQARKLYQQELPGAGALAGLAARGLITPQQYFSWVPYTGLPGELWEQTREAAYSGLGARRMLPLIQTGLFTQADIADELTFSALRPASMHRYLLAAPFLATTTERNQLRTELENAYVAGVLSDADLTSAIDSAYHNTDRDNLILTRVHYVKLVNSTKALETEYVTLYKASLFTEQQLTDNLAAIGLQQDVVTNRVAVAQAQLNATLHRKEIAAAAVLERATATAERKAAMRNFTTGNIDPPALAIALIATGLTATQTAAWVDLAVLQKAGGLRWKYGVQLPAPAATLLGQQVTALTDQRKRLQISDAQYVAGLQALGIPPTYVNALQATADALISPKTKAFAIPVQT
jgi:hypothetical protein